MKKEYDFSGGTRGKFYRGKVKLTLPVYLDPDNLKFVEDLARRRKSDPNQVVNDLLRGDQSIAKAVTGS